MPAETRAPLPREPEQIPATVPAASTEVAQQKSAQQSPAAASSSREQGCAARSAYHAPPATVLAPATVQEWSQPVSERDRLNSQICSWAACFWPALLFSAGLCISEVRRRVSVSVYRSPAPAMGPRFDAVEPETTAEKIAAPSRLAGGPPQVSLQLKASEPSVRRAAVPFGKMSRPFGAGGATVPRPETARWSRILFLGKWLRFTNRNRRAGAAAVGKRARAFRGCGDAVCRRSRASARRRSAGTGLRS